MAYDEDDAQIFRDALASEDGITERKMFGGLCLMWQGHMVCGVMADGGMVRVGKENVAAALELEGIEPLEFGGRVMGSMVDVSFDVMNDKDRLDVVLDMALKFVKSLPPK